MEPADAVLRFVEGLGRSQDAEFYLALFRAEAKERFATISVDSWVARNALDAVLHDLTFLAAMGLTPIVVLGLVEPALADEHAVRLRRRLERNRVAAVVLPSAEVDDLAGEAARAARQGTIPIVPFDAADGVTADERFGRLGGVIGELATRKLIFLIRRGIFRHKGQVVPLVNLTTDYDSLAISRDLSRKQQLLLQQSRRLVYDLVPHKLLISVTSPLDLLRELFTVKGAGTLLRRGAVIERRAGMAELDRERLSALIASAFGRPPLEAFFTRAISRIYLEEQYRGAAVMIDTPLGGYLTKFAVERVAQGEGIGRDLWQSITADYKVFFWRARPQNPIAAWYGQQADGLCRFDDWHVFWKGLTPERIPDAIAYSLAAPIDIPS